MCITYVFLVFLYTKQKILRFQLGSAYCMESINLEHGEVA